MKVPLYLHKQCTLGRMIKSFQTGHSHMAIICNTAEGAAELRERADLIINNLQHQNSMDDSQQVDESILDLTREIIGIVTLENVIERILLTDIHDEKDREEAMTLLQKKAPAIQTKVDTSDADIFKNTRVQDYYNGLLQDVQRTISNFNSDNDSNKITLSEVSGMGGSTNKSKFGNLFKSISAADDNDVEMLKLKRRDSKH